MELSSHDQKIQPLWSRLGSICCHDHSWRSATCESILRLSTSHRWKQRSNGRVDSCPTLGLAWRNLRDSPRLATSCRMDPRTLRSNRRILEKTRPETDRGRTKLRILPAQERSSQPPQIPHTLTHRSLSSRHDSSRCKRNVNIPRPTDNIQPWSRTWPWRIRPRKCRRRKSIQPLNRPIPGRSDLRPEGSRIQRAEKDGNRQRRQHVHCLPKTTPSTHRERDLRGSIQR